MFKKLVINGSMKSIRGSYPEYDDIKLEEIQYGLEAIYVTFTKVIVILLLSLILRIFKETLVLLLLFNLLRTTGFGLHASKSWMCWVSSLITFIGIPLICKYSTIPFIILLTISLLSLLSFILWAPADTIKKPLIRKNRRKIYKFLTVIFGICYIIALFIIKDTFLRNAITCSMLIETVLICPLTYKIFNLTYNNYKDYLVNNV